MEHTTQAEHAHKKENKINNTVIAILVGALLIAAAILYSGKFNKISDTSFVDPDTMFSGREIKQEELIVGNIKSKVIVLEYSDLECPFCKKFHIETMNNIYEKYDKEVGFAFRHFPLTFHKKAPKQAEATLCIREQGGQAAYKNYISKYLKLLMAMTV